MVNAPFELITYQGTPQEDGEVKKVTRDLTSLADTLSFIAKSETIVTPFATMGTSLHPLARVYAIWGHGCNDKGKHYIDTSKGLVSTLDFLLEDFERRDPRAEVPTIVFVESCHSGALISSFPKNKALFTSADADDVSYGHGSLFATFAESGVQAPLVYGQLTTSFIERVFRTGRLSEQDLERMLEDLGERRKRESPAHTNTLSYNGYDLAIDLPKRTDVELFDGLYRHNFRDFERAGHKVPNVRTPKILKEKYMKVLRGRRDELTFEHLNPGFISFGMMISAPYEFGIPFTRRLLNTLEDTPTNQWINIWHRYHRKYQPRTEGHI